VLDAPGNDSDGAHMYVLQMCVSWPYRAGFFGRDTPIEIPETVEEQRNLIHDFAKTWAEPWGTLALGVSVDSDVKGLKIQDLPPPADFQTTGRAALMGDALHAMAMCKYITSSNHWLAD
jgi:hypothetical protein